VNLHEIASRFQGVNWSGDEKFYCRCPGHDDQHASLSVGTGETGVVLFCHVCGKEGTENLLAAVGLTFPDLMNGSNGNGHRAGGMNITATYLYPNENGIEQYHINRTAQKKFFVEKPDGTKGLGKTPRVLYNLPAIVKADPDVTIYVPEGEKDCNTLTKHGLTATTAPFGAEAPWLPTYSERLRGRHVAILPDRDDPGHRYAQTKARALHGIAASVKVVNLYDGPIPTKHGKDISDWLNEGHDVEELVRLEEAAPEWTPANPHAGVKITAAAETPGDPDLQPHIDSGVSNMERLVSQHHQDVRYLKGPGYYAWDGRRFAPDAEAELVRRAITTVRTMYHEAAAIEDEKARIAFLSHIRRSESEPEIRRMVTLAQSHRDIYIAKAAHFDRDRMLLNLHNGTLDLRTRELHPHRRDDLITKLAGCAYDPNAKCPTFLAFLERIFDGSLEMREFVKRLAGYCLTAEVREHVLPIFWGDGSNGKTTLIETMLALLGEYGTIAPPELLVVRRRRDHPTELMDLMGARFAAAVETPLGASLAETLVKNLTGGDRIKARHVFKDYVEFPPTHKLVMATNHRPVIEGTDNAIWRRLLLVPFTVTIAPEDQDEHLIDKLILELPGVLNWTVQGCADWQQGGLEPPKAVKVATKAYREESDHLPAFLEECCVQQPYARVEKGTAFLEYTRWCEHNAETSMPKPELGQRFKALGVGEQKSNGKWFWTGLGLVAKGETS
jgi:putative DNA primase/helicase